MKRPAQIVAIRGAGDLASGAALRLWRSGYRVILSELAVPLCVRRSVSFANAVFEGQTKVEEAECALISDPAEADHFWEKDRIPLMIDPSGAEILSFQPDVLVDGRMIKIHQEEPHCSDAPLVIGLGPGLLAGTNVHAVVETNRGHDLGRVLWHGEAEPDTGMPGTIQGEALKRVVKAPCAGAFQPQVAIGDTVQAGDRIAMVGDTPVYAQLAGMVRGVLYPGSQVEKTLKIMDIDPRGKREYCFSVSDKANAVGGGVLEAILTWSARGSAGIRY